jgi:hypothetical protein
VTVVVRLTVVVVVGGGVVTTSSFLHAPKQVAPAISRMRRENVIIFAKSKLRTSAASRISFFVLNDLMWHGPRSVASAGSKRVPHVECGVQKKGLRFRRQRGNIRLVRAKCLLTA